MRDAEVAELQHPFWWSREGTRACGNYRCCWAGSRCFSGGDRSAVIERISKATKFPFWAARRDHSIGFLSRTEVDYHEWHYPAGARHSFLEIIPAGSKTRVFGLHLSARFSKWDERRRTREIRSLLEGIKRHQNGFHVLVGDFNTLAPGEVLEFHRLPAWIRALIWISGRKLQRETIQLDARCGLQRWLSDAASGRQGIHVSNVGSAREAGLRIRAASVCRSID